jgi:hypothetical protein
MTEAQRTSDIYGILLDQNVPCVLMLRDDAYRWTLPHFHVPDERVYLPMVGIVCTGMGKLLAADMTVLRNVDVRFSADRAHIDLIYVLENHTENWIPQAQSEWIDRTALANLSLANPEHREVIDGILEEAESNHGPPLRTPWAQLGWFKQASGWMHDQLVAQGYVLTAPIEQFKSWGISCLLRAQTDRGDIFFKVASSLPLFGNEPMLLKSLSERYPDAVPVPIAIEPVQRWMLMSDFGTELRSIASLEKWETAIHRFGQLQVQAVSKVEDLFAIGCLDRRLDVLTAQIDPLVNDTEVLATLSRDEAVRLRELAPRLKAMCDQLAGYRVPYSLNHGDLHSGNITGETVCFFDWTDACIAHPFLDLCTMVSDIDEVVPDEREHLVDAYLSQWLAYEPMDRLRELWRLAEPLGALHQGVSYQHILATLEPAGKQELAGGVSYWLRWMLRTLPE